MGVKVNQAAEAVLRIFRGGPAKLRELLELGSICQRANRLDDARRLFEKALLDYSGELSEREALKIARDLVVCTYKDPDLPADTRLSAAEQMLLRLFGNPPDGQATPLQVIVSDLSSSLGQYPDLKQDLLGIAGAVEKRRWEIYGLRTHLVRAYQYYFQGYQMGSAHDQGYNGINLAFVLDLLSLQEEGELDQADLHADMASAVRNEIIATLDAQDGTRGKEMAEIEENDRLSWWLLVTLGEAYLGARELRTGRGAWMSEAAALKANLEYE